VGSGRNRYLLVVASLVVSSLVATVAAVPRVVRPPAEVVEATPAGLFSCSRGGDGGEEAPPSDLDLILDGLIASLLSGSNFFTFQGLVPAGVPVAADPDEPAPVPDPETGGTLFTRSLGSARLGQTSGVDFLTPGGGGVPGAEGDEITLELLLRGTAGADGDDMGLRRLLNQNFGVPDDPGGDVGVLGVDVDLTANEALTALPSGFRGRFEGVFGFTLPDGTAQAAGFRFEGRPASAAARASTATSPPATPTSSAATACSPSGRASPACTGRRST
jgi:hypothetical protein